MSDFWGGLSNFRFPDARIDADRNAPLPTTLSGPAGINGEADGKYNFNGELLSGIAPYAGPKTGRISSDRNYQQIPHRKQVFVPQVYVPNTEGSNQVRISHAVDQGDLAFVINPRQRAESLLLQRGQLNDRALVKQSATVPTIVNLATLNYLLGGLHTYLKRICFENGYGHVEPGTLPKEAMDLNLWGSLANDMFGEQAMRELMDPEVTDKYGKIQELIYDFFKWRIVPFGVCAGSEKQGGQHEVGLAPVQAAASHMTTLTVDGRNQDLVNLWFNNRVFAGDELCLHLRMVPPPTHYTLNHYYKETQSQSGFHRAFPLTATSTEDEKKLNSIAQITPSTARSMLAEAMAFKDKLQGSDIRTTAHTAYWRIARSFVEKPSTTKRNNDRFGELGTATKAAYRFEHDHVLADDAALMRAHILEVNFAPVFVDNPVSGGSAGGGRSSKSLEEHEKLKEDLHKKLSEETDKATEELRKKLEAGGGSSGEGPNKSTNPFDMYMRRRMTSLEDMMRPAGGRGGPSQAAPAAAFEAAKPAGQSPGGPEVAMAETTAPATLAPVPEASEMPDAKPESAKLDAKTDTKAKRPRPMKSEKSEKSEKPSE